MFGKLKTSFKNISHKMFISLLIMGLVPTIYTTLRVFWLGNLPGDWSYSIAGQLSWINLIYEVINEAIILPLFYFVGKVLSDKKELTNRMKTGLLITLGIYIILSIFIMTCTNPLLKAMASMMCLRVSPCRLTRGIFMAWSAKTAPVRPQFLR